MTHNPEENATMTGGTGFVLVPAEQTETARIRAAALEELAEIDGPLWPGIEDDVAELERLLR